MFRADRTRVGVERGKHRGSRTAVFLCSSALSAGLAGCGSDEDRAAPAASDVALMPEALDTADNPPGAAAGALEPAPGEYGTRADLLQPNSEMAVAELGGKIYVLGGYPASRVVQSAVQVYDSARDTWSLGPELPVPTHHPVVVGVASKLYSLGGQLEGDINGGRSFGLDPSTGVWTELTPLPTPRGGGAAAVIDDEIYVVGGRPPAGNAFEVYDISDGAWSSLPNLPLMYNHVVPPERVRRAGARGGCEMRVHGGTVWFGRAAMNRATRNRLALLLEGGISA
jgi:hypothetical protein